MTNLEFKVSLYDKSHVAQRIYTVNLITLFMSSMLSTAALTIGTRMSSINSVTCFELLKEKLDMSVRHADI